MTQDLDAIVEQFQRNRRREALRVRLSVFTLVAVFAALALAVPAKSEPPVIYSDNLAPLDGRCFKPRIMSNGRCVWRIDDEEPETVVLYYEWDDLEIERVERLQRGWRLIDRRDRR